ncbi:hypothetical protein [Mycobacterium colombiense]|nr:hypothetical protein [Mycobacterium colombiense]
MLKLKMMMMMMKMVTLRNRKRFPHSTSGHALFEFGPGFLDGFVPDFGLPGLLFVVRYGREGHRESPEHVPDLGAESAGANGFDGPCSVDVGGWAFQRAVVFHERPEPQLAVLAVHPAFGLQNLYVAIDVGCGFTLDGAGPLVELDGYDSGGVEVGVDPQPHEEALRSRLQIAESVIAVQLGGEQGATSGHHGSPPARRGPNSRCPMARSVQPVPAGIDN